MEDSIKGIIKMKIEIEIPEEEYKKLLRISNDKKISIQELLKKDVDNLIKFYTEQYGLIGISI